MDLGGLLDAAFRIYRNHFVVVVGATGLVVVPFVLVELATPAWASLWAALLGTLTPAVAARVVGDLAVGDNPTIAGVWRLLAGRVLPLIVTGIMVGVAWIVGVILLIIPGIVFYVWFAFTSPVIVIEDKAYAGAMGRSRQLVKGSWWRVFGILLLIALLVGLAEFALGIALGGLILNGTISLSSLETGEILLQGVVQLLVSPIAALVVALLYFDQRLRREGTDIAAAVEAIEPQPLPPPVW